LLDIFGSRGRQRGFVRQLGPDVRNGDHGGQYLRVVEPEIETGSRDETGPWLLKQIIQWKQQSGLKSKNISKKYIISNQLGLKPFSFI